MPDKFSKEKRSDIMSKISGKNTKPEIIVRKYLFSKGLRFRINVKALPGKPDIVLPKFKVAIFVHGCFWHGHSCKRGKLPETNKEFWQNKINKNIDRDNKNLSELEEIGWKVITIWQCEIKNKKLEQNRLNLLIEEIYNLLQ